MNVSTAAPHELSPELKEQAKEIGETDSRRAEALTELRQRIKDNALLANFRVDDAYLLTFLRARRFDVDRTISLLTNYETYRKEQAQLFGDFSDDELQHFFSQRCQFILGERSKLGGAVMVLIAGNLDLEVLSFASLMRCGIYLCEKLMIDVPTQINGLVVLVDMTGFSLTQILSTSVSDKLLAARYLHNCFPCRIQVVHIVHEPWYMNMVWPLVRPFLDARVLAKVQMHGSDMTAIHEEVDQEALPVEFGGALTTTDPMALFSKLIE